MATRARIEPIRSLAFGSITGSYVAIGATITEPTRWVYLFNDTDQRIYFSNDGTTDKFLLPAGGFLVMDITSNKGEESVYVVAEGDHWYAKHAGVAPTVRAVYVTLMY